MDAYVELAALQEKKDLTQAVNTLSRYPYAKEASANDAFVHGEIVRLLFKAQAFDDPRLEEGLVL